MYPDGEEANSLLQSHGEIAIINQLKRTLGAGGKRPSAPYLKSGARPTRAGKRCAEKRGPRAAYSIICRAAVIGAVKGVPL